MQLAVELPYDFDPNEFLDKIIETMSVGKTNESPFFGSDMLGFGASNVFTYTVEDEGIKVFALSENFDLSTQTDKAVYVYLNDNQLVVNRDYVFDKTFEVVKILLIFIPFIKYSPFIFVLPKTSNLYELLGIVPIPILVDKKCPINTSLITLLYPNTNFK